MDKMTCGRNVQNIVRDNGPVAKICKVNNVSLLVFSMLELNGRAVELTRAPRTVQSSHQSVAFVKILARNRKHTATTASEKHVIVIASTFGP
jgi:hypothetical protein